MLSALLRFTCPFDMTGSPTITLPCGFTEQGLPVAFQFVARHMEEDRLVRAGHAFQTATDWHRQHPPIDTLEVRETSASGDEGVGRQLKNWSGSPI